jgi:hypothetical protein
MTSSLDSYHWTYCDWPMVISYMFLHILLLPKCLVTYLTYMWALACVDGLVILQSIWTAEWRSTNVTREWAFITMDPRKTFSLQLLHISEYYTFRGKWICESVKFQNTVNSKIEPDLKWKLFFISKCLWSQTNVQLPQRNRTYLTCIQKAKSRL